MSSLITWFALGTQAIANTTALRSIRRSSALLRDFMGTSGSMIGNEKAITRKLLDVGREMTD